MQFLSQRAQGPELIDGNDWTHEEYLEAMDQLVVIDRLTRCFVPVKDSLLRYLKKAPPIRSLRLLDIGCGTGELFDFLAPHLLRKNVRTEGLGLDLNEFAIGQAARRHQGSAFRFASMNAFDLAPNEKFDFVFCCQTFHHLTDQQIVEMLQLIHRHARLGWIVTDLHRHWLSYWFIKWTTRIFSRNRLIQNDAPLSVARSFKKREWIEYLNAAGIPRENISIRWHWSFRYHVIVENHFLK